VHPRQYTQTIMCCHHHTGNIWNSLVLFELYGEMAWDDMDATMCGAHESEIKEVTVAKQDADHHWNICSLFLVFWLLWTYYAIQRLDITSSSQPTFNILLNSAQVFQVSEKYKVNSLLLRLDGRWQDRCHIGLQKSRLVLFLWHCRYIACGIKSSNIL
jgi:hypothetical protein